MCTICAVTNVACVGSTTGTVYQIRVLKGTTCATHKFVIPSIWYTTVLINPTLPERIARFTDFLLTYKFVGGISESFSLLNLSSYYL